MGGVLLLLGGGCQLPTTRFGASLGTFEPWFSEGKSQQQSQANQPIAPVQRQSAAQASKQPAGNTATTAPSSSTDCTKSRPGQPQPASATSTSNSTFVPCSLLDFHTNCLGTPALRLRTQHACDPRPGQVTDSIQTHHPRKLRPHRITFRIPPPTTALIIITLPSTTARQNTTTELSHIASKASDPTT